jgi:hypothetical protein
LLKQCEQKYTEFIGLSAEEIKFMEVFKFGKFENATGSTFAQIKASSNKSPQVVKMMETLE